MAKVEYVCAEHGVVEAEESTSDLHAGKCSECGMPVGSRIGGKEDFDGDD